MLLIKASVISIISALFVLAIGHLSILNKISIGIAVVIIICFLIISFILILVGFLKKDYALCLPVPISIISILFFKFFINYQYNENLRQCEKVFKTLDIYKQKHGILRKKLNEAYVNKEQIPKLGLGFSRINLEYTPVTDFKFFRISFPSGFGFRQTWDSSFHSWDFQD